MVATGVATGVALVPATVGNSVAGKDLKRLKKRRYNVVKTVQLPTQAAGNEQLHEL